MRVFAPGKLVVAGAYAVLEGAPAIVVSVGRGAYADASRSATTCTPEVRAALGDDASAPEVDASAMFVSGRKLGLGASAAILVASLGARAARAGALLSDAAVRADLFAKARDAHARVQAGGSGVDVAASVHGGALEYRVGAAPKAITLPSALVLTVYACPMSARTSELRAQVDALAARDGKRHRVCLDDLGAIAALAVQAIEANDAEAFVCALRKSARALARLGEAAGATIVPDGFAELEELAVADGGSFSVSGAGGGDVAVHFGPRTASARFEARARQLGLFPLDLALDYKGVRIAPTAPAHAGSLSAISDRT